MSDLSAVDVPHAGPGPLRPLAAPAAVAAVFIALVGLADLILAWSAWHAYQVVTDYVGGSAELADLRSADRLTSVVSILDVVVSAVAGIAFLRWLWCARLNAESLSAAEHRRSRGWTIGGWFCPFVNFWFPPMIVNDVWRTSRPDAAHVTDIKTLPTSPLVSWWWWLFLLTSLFGRYAITVQIGQADSVEALHNGARDLLAANVVRIIAAVLIVLVIKRINDWQRLPRTAPQS
jgi:hypothetical protein